MSASETAKAIGTTSGNIMAWYRAGIIPAEVAEGKVFRFDVEKVRMILAKRAKRHQERPDWCPPPHPIQFVGGQYQIPKRAVVPKPNERWGGRKHNWSYLDLT